MKKLSLIMGLALAGTLVACGGGNAPASSSASVPATTSVAPSSSSVSSSSSSAPEVTTKYEHVWNYFSLGDAEKYEDLPASKHQGPNYALQLALEKDGKKAVLSRKIVYMNMGSGDPFLNSTSGGFSVEGTWDKNADGTYKVNLPEYNISRGVKDDEGNPTKYPATELVSNADGSILIKYGYGSKEVDDGEGGTVKQNKLYETTVQSAGDFVGEYEGHYVNEEKEENTIEGFEVVAASDNTYTITGAIEDTGISAFTATVDSYGVVQGTIDRLDGTLNGWFYMDEGVAKCIMHMYARERHSVVYANIL
ncbi:MAG: hypothetical protein J6A47_01020 [Bacilli bacterium]|nr:hypothetical protein [Bacilli bacterium]